MYKRYNKDTEHGRASSVERVRAEHPAADIEVWCEDEHRVGLQPVTRRLWVEEGE